MINRDMSKMIVDGPRAIRVTSDGSRPTLLQASSTFALTSLYLSWIESLIIKTSFSNIMIDYL